MPEVRDKNTKITSTWLYIKHFQEDVASVLRTDRVLSRPYRFVIVGNKHCWKHLPNEYTCINLFITNYKFSHNCHYWYWYWYFVNNPQVRILKHTHTHTHTHVFTHIRVNYNVYSDDPGINRFVTIKYYFRDVLNI